MRLRPRHYVLLAVILGLFIFNIVRHRRDEKNLRSLSRLPRARRRNQPAQQHPRLGRLRPRRRPPRRSRPHLRARYPGPPKTPAPRSQPERWPHPGHPQLPHLARCLPPGRRPISVRPLHQSHRSAPHRQLREVPPGHQRLTNLTWVPHISLLRCGFPQNPRRVPPYGSVPRIASSSSMWFFSSKSPSA